MSKFPPIAVIGRGCVLPGALSPDELWNLVAGAEHALGDAPDGYWGVDPEDVLTDPDDPEIDHTWTARGGFVRNFDDVFDPTGFHLPEDELTGLDPLFKWSLYAARQAMTSAGLDLDTTRERAGIILGNKSYPTHSLANFAEDVWRTENGQKPVHETDPKNRFMSGLPAQLVAQAVGFEGKSFCLDVACASSLYAIKLACDRLHDGEADVMLAGGINRADDLFLRIGFCALQAMSNTGQSRPFHREADGLVPAEGAAFVALKRLDDAVEHGDDILGVIRGVGLSNDGRSRGLLTPSEDGQVRCMKQAYEQSGLTPDDLSLVECHAAGTALGDATEIRSVSRIFEDSTLDEPIPVASLKSNLGHLITVSGVAGLLKMISAIEHQQRPATLNADDPIDELKDGPLRPLQNAEPWECDGPRRAAINNFGFGGNNAHLLVEQWLPDAGITPVEVDLDRPADLAVVDMAVLASDGRDRTDFARSLLYGESAIHQTANGPEGRADEIELDIGKVRFPPNDLQKALPQQLRILEATLQLEETIDELPDESTGIMLGMQCDPEVARFLVRWRLQNELVDGGEDHRDGLIRALDAAGVLGSMPNLVTNRLNSQFDLAGHSLTVSAEELSGMRALTLAQRALRNEELDAAVVGAVDMCCEPVQKAAARAVLPEDRHVPGDAAVAMVVKRLDDAKRDGDDILATICGEPHEEDAASVGDLDTRSLFGHSHAVSGLLDVAAAVESARRRTRPAAGELPPMPWLPDRGTRRATVEMDTVTGDRESIPVDSSDSSAQPLVEQPPPKLFVYRGSTLDELKSAVERRDESFEGSLRLAICGRPGEIETRHNRAAHALGKADPAGPITKIGPGVYLGDESLGGETAFVFTGPAGSYRGMGRELVLAMPELADEFARRCRAVDRAAGWIYGEEGDVEPGPGEKLWGASFLCQIHAQLTRDVLGISPEAAIGFCAGETNALFAMGAWNDFDGLYEDLENEGIFDRRIGGEFETVRRAWDAGDDVDWQTWRILAPLEAVEPVVDREDRCYVTIHNAPGDLVIGGAPDACKRVISEVGKKRARPLGYNVAMHCPATGPIEELWYDMHHRPTESVDGVRFYTHASLDSYEVDADKIADALVGQALNRVEFPKLIRRAHDDGVRVFVEHGPRSGCTRWIRKILGDRDHVAVSLDRTGKSSLNRSADTAARLAAAGVDIDHDEWNRRVDRTEVLPPSDVRTHDSDASTLTFPAHLPPVHLQQGEVPNSLPLPPVLPTTKRPTPQTPAPEPQPQLHTEPTPKPEPAPQPEPKPNGRAHTTAGYMAEAHEAFLERRVELHREFLHQQHRHQQWLIEAYQNGEPPPPPHKLHRPPQPTTHAPRPTAQPPRSKTHDPRPTTQDSRPKTQDPRPTTHDPSPTTQDPRPTTHDPGPTTHDPSPATQDPRSTTSEALFDRDDLKTHASGDISEIFGEMFRRQDDYPRQVRMPEPPLLLADRVTDIDAEPGAMEDSGVIWTETDVTDDAWYLHRDRMPVGITVESGQADLMLISWMGVDFQNRGERVYRLLGCELTFHGELPSPGESLEFEIHIDSHARQGDVHLFFFHYDCVVDGQPRLTMRKGQAGFFTDEELADSEGVIWTPDDIDEPTTPPVEPPKTPDASSFSKADLEAFSEGRAHECFGEGFERTAAHTETPKIQGERMLFLDEVTDFDIDGGPHERGYLRAVQNVSPDDWFFDGHFKNDPCMPGTLMLQGCVQAMSFYLTGLGFTLDRDGWRFEPVPDDPCNMRCRGQVTPTSRQVVYELWVREIDDGPQPTLYADLMCTVDGLKAFHCERLGIRLVPDWPLERHPEWIDDVESQNHGDAQPAVVDGFAYDQASVMACCLGRPSDAFGPMYERFDGPKRAPRLPNPPYLFISRIADIDAARGAMEQGSRVVAEYDVPDDAWYFDTSYAADTDGERPAMPFCNLMEVGLQPCGWLASYVGCALSTDEELFFRNLDGTSTVHREITPSTHRLRTESTLKTISGSGGMIIVAFDVETYADGELAFEMDTVFGFFPAEALASQNGLPAHTQPPKNLDATQLSDFRLPTSDFRLNFSFSDIRAAKDSPERILATTTVDPNAWYFKSHFFQDPVQPGSLGVEGMLQLLQAAMQHRGMADEIDNPVFVPIQTDRQTSWKYRGQVVPENDEVVFDLQITDASEPNADVPYAVATASLWVDGTRIYEVEGLGCEIVSSETPVAPTDDTSEVTFSLDPETDTWLKDHRPTFTRPALPMTSIADCIAQAASKHTGESVVELRDVDLHGWAVVDGPTALTASVEQTKGSRAVTVKLQSPAKQLAGGTVETATELPASPEPLAELETTTELPDPYETGAVFHGPAFQLLEEGFEGESGSRGVLDASKTDVPVGAIHPALLDAALHIIPHDELSRWSGDVEEETVAYPHRIENLSFHTPPPTDGLVEVEVRFDGFAGAERFPRFRIQFLDGDQIWADMTLVEVLFPKGRIARGDPENRRAFLRDRQYVPGLGVSHFEDGETRLTVKEFRNNDWFEGTIAAIYDVAGDLVEMTRRVAIKDHLAQRLEAHPSEIDVDGATGVCAGESHDVRVDNDGPMAFVVRDP